ncbi:UNVERIFIED_CONTAM: hypothetical protein OHV15_08275 [Microbacterium sp. SLM126]
MPFDGDCTRVLTVAQLDGLLGEGWGSAADSRAEAGYPLLRDLQEVSIGTLGGIECVWFPAEPPADDGTLALEVVLLPAAQVPPAFAAAYSEVDCDYANDAFGCRLGKQVGDYWLMTRTILWSDEPPTELMVRAADAVAATVGDAFDGVAAERQPDWATVTDCETFSERMRLEEFLGTGYVSGRWEGSAPPEEGMLASAGVGWRCPWFSVDGSAPNGAHYIMSADVAAGAWWAWEQMAAADAAVPVTVDGAVGAVTFDLGNDQAELVATDGVNVINVRNAPLADLIPLAERMLSTLAG